MIPKILNSNDYKFNCVMNLDEFANNGLRTLMFAKKEIFH